MYASSTACWLAMVDASGTQPTRPYQPHVAATGGACRVEGRTDVNAMLVANRDGAADTHQLVLEKYRVSDVCFGTQLAISRHYHHHCGSWIVRQLGDDHSESGGPSNFSRFVVFHHHPLKLFVVLFLTPTNFFLMFFLSTIKTANQASFF